MTNFLAAIVYSILSHKPGTTGQSCQILGGGGAERKSKVFGT